MSARAVVTSAQEMYGTGSRVDASYHASPGVRALRFLKHWQQADSTRRVDALSQVCISRGIFIPGRFKRFYVNDPAHGERWLSPSDMLKADLNDLPLVSRKLTPSIDRLRLHQGWILISRSGSIGNMAYTRQDMDGLIGSDDIIRIVPDTDQIASGYLYAFLSSTVGKSLIEQQTYGAVIQHIEAHHVTDLPIPRLDPATEQRIHDLIERAAALRVAALHSRSEAIEMLSSHLGIDISRFAASKAVAVRNTNLNMRLEANYHAAHQVANDIFEASGLELVPIGELLRDIFYLGKLHRVFVDSPENGVPMLSISDVLKAKITSEKYISKTLSRNVEQAKLQEGTVLISRTGTPGLVVYVRREMAGMAGSDDLVRLIPDQSKVLSGYLYTILMSEFGQSILFGSVHGSVQLKLPPVYINLISIPLLDIKTQKPIHDLIKDYGENLTQASELEDEAQALLLAALGWEG